MTMQIWNGDIDQALKWMHSNAPNIQSLINQKKDWYGKFSEQFWLDWEESVFDLDTANNFGLMIWCIILGVPSQLFGLYPPTGAWAYGDKRQNFVYSGGVVPDPNMKGGNFYGGGAFTLLTQQEIRWALKLRYAALVSNGRLSFINYMLNWVFNKGETWDYGSGKYFYVTDVTGTAPAYTNLVAHPEDLTFWTVDGSSVVSDDTDSPYVGVLADRLVENSANSEHKIKPDCALTSPPGLLFTASVYAKADERDSVFISAIISGTPRYAVFSLSAGIVISNDIPDGSPGMIKGPDGWWRCFVTFPGSVSANTWVVGMADSMGDTSYLGDGSSGLFVWGAQAISEFPVQPYYAQAAPAIAAPPATAFNLHYHAGPNMGFSPQFINLLNATQYGILPSCAGSKTTVIQD